ncbi:MAG: glycerate dehydrogenase [Pseudomonadales bacterium]|nr:glycerate dehydrogenase [Pseudomonadales bacterium]
MKGVVLDTDTLGSVDISPIINCFSQHSVYTSATNEDIHRKIHGARALVVNKTRLTKSIIHQAKELQFISIMATGTNNVDLDAARAQNIAVSNALAYATPSVVQHTLNLMLNLATQLPRYLIDVDQGKWQQSPVFTLLDHPIVELQGKTLGIVGFGELGSNVAKVAQAFGMQTLIAGRKNQSNRLPLKILLPKVDYLSLHCPLTAENTNLINQQTLQLMKPTAFLINTARGGLVNSDDLVAALKNGIIQGAAIDVLTTEPPTNNDPLIQARHLPNLILTPHNAWGSIEARHRLVLQTQENIQAFQKGKPIRLVN